MSQEHTQAGTTEAVIEEQPGPLRRWIMKHDDSWLFIVPYIGLAVILSIAISLFWLVVVVAVHFAIEWIRQQAIKPGFQFVLPRVLWELKLDIALILFALALALYMELTLGLVGLGSAGRAGAMAGARFVVIQRVLRGVLLSLDDLAQVMRVVMRRSSKGDNATEVVEDALVAEAPEESGGWFGKWGIGDYVAVGLGAFCLLLIVIAPLITDYDLTSMLVTLAEELHPWPFGD